MICSDVNVAIAKFGFIILLILWVATFIILFRKIVNDVFFPNVEEIEVFEDVDESKKRLSGEQLFLDVTELAKNAIQSKIAQYDNDNYRSLDSVASIH
uniref:Uncharacterized protein n=1 Tax=Caenorhabditis japonica TaxID=281687 RepID=A0A8R1HU02_CAEJA